jgi:catechol 2,3-dioxygenase-like lactoylglutathione lyase family enzyme
MLNRADLMAFVPVSDLARARRFSEGTLGLELHQADHFGCMLAANGTTLRLARMEDCARPAFTVLGGQVASNEASRRRGIEATVAALTAAGVAVLRYEGLGQDDAGTGAHPPVTGWPGSPRARATPGPSPSLGEPVLREASSARARAVLFAPLWELNQSIHSSGIPD